MNREELKETFYSYAEKNDFKTAKEIAFIGYVENLLTEEEYKNMISVLY